MAQGASRSVARQIGALFDVGSAAGFSDRQLLDRFNARRDAAGEAAFAAVVQRHGPMVLDVCRQLLGDSHNAEDAFQAVFLVLARKAGAIRDPDRLGTWLYGVAIRTSRKARARVARVRRNEEADAMDPERPGPVELAASTAPTVEESAIDREQAEALHDEIDRLPRPFRLPVVLCYFEGLTLDEAARRLHWPAGTVRSRLARARDKLRHGLTRRGVVLPAAAIVAALGRRSAAASVPAPLCQATTRSAIRFSAGQAVPAAASALAREVIRSMLIHQSAVVATIALAVAAGAGLLGRFLSAKDQPAPGRPVPNAAVLARAGTRTSQPPAPAGAPAAPAAEPPRSVGAPVRPLSPWGEPVDRAIRRGVRFLEQQQRPDGSWPDVEADSKTGTTSLVTLALLAAGEKPDAPAVRRALEVLRAHGPEDLRNTYAIGLQTMVFAVADLEQDRPRIAANVDWLDRAQIKPDDGVAWPGSWTYNKFKRGTHGDGSNTQYALLGLHAASEAGVPVRPEVWNLARDYWTRSQRPDGGWAYTPYPPASSASMTCAGISSLILSGLRRFQGEETLHGDEIKNCGKGRFNRDLQRGIDWMATHFQVRENFGHGHTWRYYYLYGLERAGRLAGVRFFGKHDWYRVGAEELVQEQDRSSGAWRGVGLESREIVATSFALLFLAKGRAPVLIQKLRHAPLDDWNHDPGDVANLVGVIGRDWKTLLTWQVVDSREATVPDLLRSPILFLNGHRAPEFTPGEKENLRDYVDQGGLIFAEACCGERRFDEGFRMLMQELFPEDVPTLRPIPEDHPIWRARHALDFASHPLWGVWRGGRIAVVYSPTDLSCYWDHADEAPTNPAVARAIRVGQNVIDYATRRQLPPDKLTVP